MSCCSSWPGCSEGPSASLGHSGGPAGAEEGGERGRWCPGFRGVHCGSEQEWCPDLRGETQCLGQQWCPVKHRAVVS